MLHYYFKAVKFFGSRNVKTRAREGGASVFTSFVFPYFPSVPPPSEKIAGGFEQAGKKKKGSGENEFLPACSARRRRAVGWEAARPCASKEAKPAKIDSLIEEIFCARPLKNVSIFAGFVRRQAASRWAGLPPAGRQLVGVLFEKGSDFVQKVPPFFRIRILCECCLAPPAAGLGFRHDFIRIFEVAKQFLPAQTEVRRAKLGQNEILQTNLFSFAFGERQSDNLILTAQII